MKRLTLTLAAALAACAAAPAAQPDFGWTTYERGFIAADADEAATMAREWLTEGGGTAVRISAHPDGFCVQTDLQRRRFRRC